MPALSFSGSPNRGDFWRLILANEKTMTTRYPRKKGGIKKGDTVALYWKQRTPAKDKPIHLIGYVIVKEVYRCPSLADAIREIPDYVKQEGFAGLLELYEWWGIDEEHSIEDMGPLDVIVWDPFGVFHLDGLTAHRLT